MTNHLKQENPSHPSEALLEMISSEIEKAEKFNSMVNKIEEWKNGALDVVYEADPELAQDLAHSIDGTMFFQYSNFFCIVSHKF